MKRILFFVFLPFLTFSQQTKEVLFVGNSYTFYNDLPNMVKQIALSFGDTLNYETSTPGGASFNMHSTNTTTISKINQKVWDYVVLQAQSQEPSLSTNYVNTNVYPAVQSLIDIIENNSNCIEPMFFMTWGRKYGDASNCTPWPPVCTYLGMQQQLRIRYLDFTFTHDASCSPVGMAWKESIEQDSTLNLYSPDNSHPSLEGSYLSACTFYSSLFKKTSIGSSYIPNGIDSASASFLQNIASNIVLDSLSTWNIFNVDGVLLDHLSVVDFLNFSSNYESVIWDFGDSTTSTLENGNHIYDKPGTYTITLTAFTNDSCVSESISVDITLSFATSISETNINKEVVSIIDVLGRETTESKNTILFYLYKDGRVEKKMVIE
jgi:hypothetical protein